MTTLAILATSAPSHGTQAFLYFLALVLFAVAAGIAWPVKYASAIALGLALMAGIAMWTQIGAA